MATSSGCHDSVWVKLGKRSVETVELDGVNYFYCTILDTMIVGRCDKCRLHKPDAASGKCEFMDREWDFEEKQHEFENEQEKVVCLDDLLVLVLEFYGMDTQKFVEKYGHGMTTKEVCDRIRAGRRECATDIGAQVISDTFDAGAIGKVRTKLSLYFNSKGIHVMYLNNVVRQIITAAERASSDPLDLTDAMIGAMEGSPENRLDRYGSIGKRLNELAREVADG
jgi:hypothetical protein